MTDEPVEREYRAKRITDPRELRALSHPLRVALLGELYSRGQGSVTQLAAAVGEPINKVSFHLRQLAKYGLLAEAPELARDGRDRWWRLLYPDGVEFESSVFAAPGGQRARREANHRLLDRMDQIRDYFTASDPGPGPAFVHDWYLRLTPEQLREFDREYLDLCRRWRDRIQEETAGEDDVERRRYVIQIFGFPQDTIDERPR